MIYRVLIVLMIILCIAVGYGFNKYFEFYDDVQTGGWSAKAKANHYLAAQQFLQKTGITARSSDQLSSFQSLPHSNGVLLLESSMMVFSDRQLKSLLDWVAKGGHLIVGAAITPEATDVDGGEVPFDQDLLMGWLGLQHTSDECQCEKNDKDKSVQAFTDTVGEAFGNEFDSEELQRNIDEGKSLGELLRDKNKKIREAKQANTPIQQLAEVLPAQGATDIVDTLCVPIDEYDPEELTSTNWYGQSVTLHFDGHSLLEHDSFLDTEALFSSPAHLRHWEGNKHGAQIAQFDWNKGLITVVTQTDIWHSGSIRQLDHGLQLWLLAEDRTEFLFLYGTQMPSVVSLLWSYGSEAVIAALVLLIFWLCYRGRRFGKAYEPVFIERRSLLEHINACAALLWHGGHSAVLIEPLRTDTRSLLIRKYPALHSAGDDEIFSVMTHISALPIERIQYAFHCQPGNRERDLQQCVTTLQKIRNAL